MLEVQKSESCRCYADFLILWIQFELICKSMYELFEKNSMQLTLLRRPGFDGAIVESDEVKTENWNFPDNLLLPNGLVINNKKNRRCYASTD